ncbi:MAG: PIN domain-containing protein [Verrucomicrobiota bacterium]
MSGPPSEIPLPLNHVFVDFENVRQIDFSVMGSKPAHFTLLVGAQQSRMDVVLVQQLLKHADSVELVRLTSPGQKALDFALAYYVGRAAAGDPTGYFHIVSKDKGFDPLIEHLRSQHIRARRHDVFATLTFSAPGKTPSTLPEAPLERALEHLRRHPDNRPKRRETLVSHVRSLLGKSATETEALDVVTELEKGGHLILEEKDRVNYRF